MGVQWDSTSTIHRLQEKSYDSARRAALYSILIEFEVPMKLFRLIKMCLNETCNKVHIGNIYLIHFLSRISWNKEMLYHHCFSFLHFYKQFLFLKLWSEVYAESYHSCRKPFHVSMIRVSVYIRILHFDIGCNTSEWMVSSHRSSRVVGVKSNQRPRNWEWSGP
jgi:hypothetical protein